jgi:hypothetical protein
MKYRSIKYTFYKIGLMLSECESYQRRVYLKTDFDNGMNAL